MAALVLYGLYLYHPKELRTTTLQAQASSLIIHASKVLAHTMPSPGFSLCPLPANTYTAVNKCHAWS